MPQSNNISKNKAINIGGIFDALINEREKIIDTWGSSWGSYICAQETDGGHHSGKWNPR